MKTKNTSPQTGTPLSQTGGQNGTSQDQAYRVNPNSTGSQNGAYKVPKK